MITVFVQTAVPWLPAGKRPVSLGDGCTVKEMLENIGLDEKQSANVLVVVNGKNRLQDDSLGEGDIVCILPVLCGG